MARLFRILVLAVIGTLAAATVRYNRLVAAEPPAPELTSKLGWLNTDRPLLLSDELKGHVVLLDFWTYCCINCMQVLPDLAYLEKKYADDPFIVVGVHSAKFNNESERESIRNAIFRYSIHHPVIIDSNFALWNEYGVHGWPSFAIIGADGRLVPIHNRVGTPIFVVSGEGRREALDIAITGALDDARQRGILANKRVEFKLDAAVPSASGLSFPGKVIAAPPRDDKPGYVFISDSSHHSIVIASWPDESDGRAMSRLLWRLGDSTPDLSDGGLSDARFNDPQGLAFDATKRVLYVADTKNHAMRAIDIGALESGNPRAAPVVATIVGTGKQAHDREGGKAGREQGLASPWDLALAPDMRTMYVAMAGTHQIWSVDLETKVARAFAGSGVEDLTDGPLESAALAQPSGLSLSADGSRLYFADSEISAVRFVDLNAKAVTTIVGHGLFDFGDVSNTFVRSRFQHCLGVAVWPQENAPDRVIVADTYNHKIKVIDQKAQRVSELLGVGRMENAKATSDLVLDEPGGVCLVPVAGGARLFIADTNNHRVVVADPATKSWHELIIDGLAPTGEASGPMTTAALQATVGATPGKPLHLLLSPALPANAELNSEAPVGIRVWKLSQDSPAATVAQRTLRAGVLPVSIEIPADAVKPGARLRVEMTFASCTHTEQALCTPGEATWEVTLEAGDLSQAELKGK